MDEGKRGRREAEERLAKAAAKAENVQALLMEAIEALRDAKKEANETLLEGIKEPLVDCLIENEDFESLSLLVRTCRSTQESVAARVRKLVYRFQQDGKIQGDDAICFLGKQIKEVLLKFPVLQHVMAVDRVGIICLADTPSTITTFEVKHEKKATSDRTDIRSITRNKNPFVLKKIILCPSLQVLRLRHCQNLTSITNLAMCSALQELDLTRCSSLDTNTLRDLESCTGLRKLYLDIPAGVEALDINACKQLDPDAYLSINLNVHSSIKEISQLSSYPALRELSIELCQNLPVEALNVLNLCTGLEKLSLWHSTVEALPKLQACTRLSAIKLNCGELMDVRALSSVTALQELEIKGGKLDAAGCATLERCTGLKKLDLSDTGFGLPNLRVMPSLELLCLSDGTIFDISSLSSCQALRELSMRLFSSSIPDESFGVLNSCTALQKLELGGRLVDFPELTLCPHLELVVFKYCVALSYIESLVVCTALRHVSFVSCDKISDSQLATLTNCQRLESLLMDRLPLISEFPDLRCNKLNKVTVANCISLRDITCLENLPALCNLRLENCPALSNDAFKILGTCGKLESIMLQTCPQLRHVPNLQTCSKLRVLHFVSCDALKNICLLASCTSIRELLFSGCNSVSKDTLIDLRESCTWIRKVIIGKLEML